MSEAAENELPIACRLAREILSYRAETMSQALLGKATDCVLDNLAAALAGFDAPPTIGARDIARRTFGSGTAPIWFATGALNAPGAAWCNSIAASCLDFDDGHRLARGHPGSAIIPAVLAMAASKRASTREMLAAIAVGYEVAIRVATAQRYEKIQTHQSGRWTGFGVVAACGRLARLSADHLAHALAIVGVGAPNQLANGSSGYARETGNWAKEGIPLSTLQAMIAVELAQLGHTGPRDLFDHVSHYDRDPLVVWSDEPSLILDTYFKQHACCRYIHPALAAWEAIANENAIDPQTVDRIDVVTFSWALKLANKVQPDNLVDAQFSLPFCLAAQILRGPRALAPIAEDLLADRRISELAQRIHLSSEADLDNRFPEQTLARLEVTTHSGDVFSSPAMAPPAHLGRGELAEKFSAVAEGRISTVQCHEVLEIFRQPQGDLVALAGLLPGAADGRGAREDRI